MMQNTSTAVMQQRVEAHDSLDFFPTPPWTTSRLRGSRMNVIPLKIARHEEVPLLEMAGYEVVQPWSETFTLMRFARETEEMIDAHNAAVLRDNREREQWQDTFVHPDAEQLAADVVGEYARG
jgi:hypothetical protein